MAGTLPHDERDERDEHHANGNRHPADRIERLVAAALDISVLLSLRGELIEILSAMPERQSLRPASKRGHAMRRLVENIIGEILILQKRLGLRHRGQGGPRKGARPPTLASFGLTRRRAALWQARARAAPVRSYTVRIAEAADVFALKVLADELAAVARRASPDAAGRSIARAARLAAQRRGGMMIFATPAWSDKVMGFNELAGQRWRQLAKMDGAAFMALVVAGDEPKSSKYSRPPAPQVRRKYHSGGLTLSVCWAVRFPPSRSSAPPTSGLRNDRAGTPSRHCSARKCACGCSAVARRSGRSRLCRSVPPADDDPVSGNR